MKCELREKKQTRIHDYNNKNSRDVHLQNLKMYLTGQEYYFLF